MCLNYSTICGCKCGTNFHHMQEISILRLSSIIVRRCCAFFEPNSHVLLPACGLFEICKTFQSEDLIIFDTHFYDISSYFFNHYITGCQDQVTKLLNLHCFLSCITYIVFKLHNLHCLSAK